MRKTRDQEERRVADRFPIEREVHYRLIDKRREKQDGSGKTINMSSNGVLFTTECALIPGRRMEVAISWPAQLNGSVPLKLVARGRIVRCAEGKAAIAIQHYEFRTQSKQRADSVESSP